MECTLNKFTHSFTFSNSPFLKLCLVGFIMLSSHTHTHTHTHIHTQSTHPSVSFSFLFPPLQLLFVQLFQLIVLHFHLLGILQISSFEHFFQLSFFGNYSADSHIQAWHFKLKKTKTITRTILSICSAILKIS
jgi:hypothetical protein